MQAYTYIEKGKFTLVEKPKPTLIDSTDAIVKVTLGSICTSDLHIKHASVPHAVPGMTLAHEIVGIVELDRGSTSDDTNVSNCCQRTGSRDGFVRY